MSEINYEFPQMKYPEQEGLISIIVPIYNTNEVYLGECLDSLFAQTFTNWEAILVDDGSIDNIKKIIDEYANKDSRFIAIHKQNEGTLLARKTGLENSRGEFIASIDHDDAYCPQFLEKMYMKITEANTDFVYCRCQVTHKKQSYYIAERGWVVDASQNIAMTLVHPIGPTWNKLVKREIYAKIRFPIRHIVWGEDAIQTLQIVFNSKSTAFVPESLYFHRPDGFSSTTKPFLASQFIVVMNDILENLFDGIIPCNVKNAFFNRYATTVYDYFLLNNNERQKLKNEFEPLLPKFLKAEKRFNLKICLFLATKGIEFPFKLRERIKKILKVLVLFMTKQISNLK
jgi:glycosyltransferase involved in cell wall biosynthesis